MNLRIIVPGLLMAMTGVGVGDLATSGFAGMKLGVAVLWAVLLGAGFKYLLTEGLTRWQLSTGETLLSGASRHLGKPFFILFGIYFILWSYFVGAALISACGVSAAALIGMSPTPAIKAVFGLGHSFLAVLLIIYGGYRFFVRVMEACAVLLFAAVVICALAISPDWGAVISGLTIPTIPDAGGQELSWVIALMGGVGGTLTILCYGYWIREEGRNKWDDLKLSRLDLAIGYLLTALFGIAMVIIGTYATGSGKGLGLILDIGNNLGLQIGSWAQIFFLVGAWGAIFSSLLGVWQAVPMLFVDWMDRGGKCDWDKQKKDQWQKIYLLLLATIPAFSLLFEFKMVQKAYSVFGALFMPFLAILLLYMNNRKGLIGKNHRNGWLTNGFLIAILVFFAWASWLQISKKLGL